MNKDGHGFNPIASHSLFPNLRRSVKMVSIIDLRLKRIPPTRRIPPDKLSSTSHDPHPWFNS